MEMIEEESVNLKIDSYNLFNLKNRKEKKQKRMELQISETSKYLTYV